MKFLVVEHRQVVVDLAGFKGSPAILASVATRLVFDKAQMNLQISDTIQRTVYPITDSKND